MTLVKRNTGKARQKTLLCLFLATGLVATPIMRAYAAPSSDARLTRIENEIETLSRAIFKGETPPPGSLGSASQEQQANAELRINGLEDQLRTLTGMIEQQGHELQQIKTKYESTIADLQARLDTLETKAPASSAVPGIADNSLPQPSLTQPAAETNVADKADATAMYEQAYSFLKDKKYDAAEMGFTDFLDKYPAHALAANAWYWLGESYYARGKFDKAARTFAESYQKFPKGPKGPDNLLKLGLSLNGMGKKQDGCLALNQIAKDYPTGADAILARAKTEKAAMGCP